MNVLNGTEIVKLIGLPETDSRILDLIDLLGVDMSEIERDEDDDSYWIELDEEIGLNLSFTDRLITPEQKNDSIASIFLNDINFYEECKFLPFNIEILDTLESIEEKIGFKANYIEVIDEDKEIDEDDMPTYTLYWIYEELGWVTIQFFEPTFFELFTLDVRPYENPETDSWKEIVKPFIRS